MASRNRLAPRGSLLFDGLFRLCSKEVVAGRKPNSRTPRNRIEFSAALLDAAFSTAVTFRVPVAEPPARSSSMLKMPHRGYSRTDELPLLSEVKRCRPAQHGLTEVQTAGQGHAVAVIQIERYLRINLSADQPLVCRSDHRTKTVVHGKTARSLSKNVAIDQGSEACIDADTVSCPRCAEPTAGL